MQEKAKQEMLAQQQKQMNIIQQIDLRYFKLLEETLIDFKPSCNWYSYGKIALENITSINSGVPPEKLAEAIIKMDRNVNPDLSYTEFAIVSNNLEATNCAHLNLSLTDFANFLLEAKSYTDLWNLGSQRLKDQAKEEVLRENQTKDAAINGAASSPGAFGFVKGKA